MESVRVQSDCAICCAVLMKHAVLFWDFRTFHCDSLRIRIRPLARKDWTCWCCFSGLDFHEDLHRIGAKEGLKGRKLQKAMESYAWNITVLKVSVPLKHMTSDMCTHALVMHMHFLHSVCVCACVEIKKHLLCSYAGHENKLRLSETRCISHWLARVPLLFPNKSRFLPQTQYKRRIS